MGDNQQELVSVLYSVHDKLRVKKLQTKDDKEWQEAWREHTSDFKTLQEYSKAMHDLATNIWEPRNSKANDTQPDKHLSISAPATDANSDREKVKCRLEWVFHCCLDYFKFQSVLESGDNEASKLSLLDVGSCYNPFSKFESYFDIVAVDLCPAPGFEKQIYQCDFLELSLVDHKESKPNEICDFTHNFNFSTYETSKIIEGIKYKTITHLPTKSFNVVVFSYFLEYLADAKQRVESIRKAFKLLRKNGLLFILRPDSSRVTPWGNNALMKKMKVGMAFLGFKRVYFEKLEHLWCMAFKKLDEEERLMLIQSPYFKKDLRKAGLVESEVSVEDFSHIDELFSISQDFKHRSETEESLAAVHDLCDISLLEELPNFEVSFKTRNEVKLSKNM